jgi:hypothetical protein
VIPLDGDRMRSADQKTTSPAWGSRLAVTSSNGDSSRVMQMEDAMKARCLVVAMVLTSAVAGAKEPLSIRVSPGFSFAPANIVIRTSVEPDAENRSLEVIADSAEFYRSSTITLEGDRAPKTMMVEVAAFHRVITNSLRC